MSLLGNFFGGGGSNQSSQSTSSQESTQASVSGSQSVGMSQQASNQSIAFQDLFASLFGKASGATDIAAQQVPGLQDAASQLFSGGINFLGQLGGNAGTDYLNNRVTGPDQAAQAQIGALGQSLGDFFNEKLLPGITGSSVATGTLGGSRQAVAQSLAAKQVAGQFTSGAAQIFGQSQAQRDAAATALGAQTTQNAATGISSLGSLFGLAQGGANAGLSPYMALAQILGGPTVLTQSEGQSSDVASSLASSLGVSSGTSQSTSQGKVTSPGLGYAGLTSLLGGIGQGIGAAAGGG